MHRVDGAVTFADRIDGGHAPVTVGTSSTSAAALGGAGPFVLRVLASAKMYIRIGPSGVGACTTSFYAIPANTICYIAGSVDLGHTHYTAIADAAGTTLNWSIVT